MAMLILHIHVYMYMYSTAHIIVHVHMYIRNSHRTTLLVRCFSLLFVLISLWVYLHVSSGNYPQQVVHLLFPIRYM